MNNLANLVVPLDLRCDLANMALALVETKIQYALGEVSPQDVADAQLIVDDLVNEVISYLK